MVASKRGKGDDDTGKKAQRASAGEGGATVGMLTSGIKNKLARSEAYAKLKKIKDVRLRPSQLPRSTTRLVCAPVRLLRWPRGCSFASAAVRLVPAARSLRDLDVQTIESPVQYR